MKRHHVRYVPVSEGEAPHGHVEANVVNRLEAVLEVAQEDESGPVDILVELRALYGCSTHAYRHDALADIARDQEHDQKNDERILGPRANLDQNDSVERQQNRSNHIDRIHV